MAKTAVIVVVAYGRYFLPFTLSNKSKVLYIYTKPVTGNRKVARFATSSSCLFLSSFIKKCYFNGKKKYLPSFVLICFNVAAAEKLGEFP
jgi:hypothetical protein